jgi:hypothetical protein
VVSETARCSEQREDHVSWTIFGDSPTRLFRSMEKTVYVPLIVPAVDRKNGTRETSIVPYHRTVNGENPNILATLKSG